MILTNLKAITIEKQGIGAKKVVAPFAADIRLMRSKILVTNLPREPGGGIFGTLLSKTIRAMMNQTT